MKVLLDINVVLDVLLVRQPWFAESSQVWDANHNGQTAAAIAAFTVPTAFYIIRRQYDLSRAHDAVRVCLTSLAIVPVQRSTLEEASTRPGSDYEDNLQLACAVEARMDCLVTRNPSDFPAAPIAVVTPTQLLAQLVQTSP